MEISVGEAAKLVGLTRQAIQAALKKGTISGRKTPEGPWLIETSELFRVYQPAKHKKDDLAVVDTNPQTEIITLTAKLEAANALLDVLQVQNEDLKAQRDAWQQEAQDWKQKALPSGQEDVSSDVSRSDTSKKIGFWARLFLR